MKLHFTTSCFALFVVLICPAVSQAQVPGCTDAQANNFNPSATINDGSCTYNTTNLSLSDKANLATPQLDESSGIEFIKSKLWTHNDSGNSNDIFRVDTTNGAIVQTVKIANATNVDWEDITYGGGYIFIGDFGNNNGNRQNLKIYRIAENNLTDTSTVVPADVINFSYSDQTSFPSLPNNNNFDCEAMIFLNDSIHLFSKNWVDKWSKHYVIPNQPGTHVAQLRESFNAGCLITGASIQEFGVIALCGYDISGSAPVYLWMLYDYKGGSVFNGNKRRFNASSMFANGQVEAIDFLKNAYGFISNERFNQVVNIPPKIRTFNLSSYLPASFVYPKPEAMFAASATEICKNKTISFTDLSTEQPVTWQWNFPGGTPSSSTLQNPLIKYSSTGTYSVTLITGNASGYDTLTLPNYITVKSLAQAVISASGPVGFCSGGNVLLTANAGTNFSYQWKRYSSDINGANFITHTVSSSGNFKCVVTNQNGCSKTSNVIMVTSFPKPQATVTPQGRTSFCQGDSVELIANAGAGYSYQWKLNGTIINGAISQNYIAQSAGNYKVVITDSNGCSRGSANITINVNCRANHFANSDENPLVIYPNPALNTLFIRSGEISGREIIRVMDYTGNLILEKQVDFNKSIVEVNIENLTKGTYYLVISGAKRRFMIFEKL